jgi:cytochrome c
VEGENEPKQGARLTHTFNDKGVYTVRLVVEDLSGAKGEAEVEIMAGNEPPEVELAFSGNRTFYWDDRELDYELQVSDREDGDLGEEIDAGLVSFTIDYLPEGNDPTEIAMGHQTAASAAQAAAGRQLMENSDCYSCHKDNKASIGPTYQDVAERYSKDPEALGVLASRIIRGTSGNWGETAMSAHPTLTQAEAQQMVRYILSLAASPTAQSIPVKGAYKFVRHLENNTRGAYYLTASYTDQGAGEIRPLTARAEVILRHPRVSALAYSNSYLVRNLTVDGEDAGNIPDGTQLLRGDKRGYAVYQDIDLTGIAGIDLGLFLHPERFQDGRVEVRLDAPDGALLETIPVTHGKVEMTTVNVPLPGDLTGMHNLYLRFESDGGENRPVCGVEYLYFNNRTASLQSRVERASR